VSVIERSSFLVNGHHEFEASHSVVSASGCRTY